VKGNQNFQAGKSDDSNPYFQGRGLGFLGPKEDYDLYLDRINDDVPGTNPWNAGPKPSPPVWGDSKEDYFDSMKRYRIELESWNALTKQYEKFNQERYSRDPNYNPDFQGPGNWNEKYDDTGEPVPGSAGSYPTWRKYSNPGRWEMERDWRENQRWLDQGSPMGGPDST
jgi:hypothetical protein